MNRTDLELIDKLNEELANLKQCLYEATDPTLNRESDDFKDIIAQITSMQENPIFGTYLDKVRKQLAQYQTIKAAKFPTEEDLVSIKQ